MSSLTNRHEEPTNDSSTQATRAALEGLLRGPAPADWDVVNGLLQELSVVTSPQLTFISPNDDPLGRSLVSMVISKNPPTYILDATLRVFPDSLRCNPVAFFTACRFSTPEIVTQMMTHVLRTTNAVANKECPYPWILSNHISAEAAKAILQLYPQGVLHPSPCLSHFSPLDFFLMSPEMIKQRDFSMNTWAKFKLMLVAAECCEGVTCRKQDSSLSPIHVFLNRVFSRPDTFEDKDRAQHILWLLHQLRCSDKWVFEKQSSEGLYPLHYVLGHKCTEDRFGLVASRELVKLLLASHTLSARYRVNGRLPIHMALENGWPCHDLLLSLYPEALDIRDPATGFVPFQSAARGGNVGLSLDVTFELIRANPSHVDCRLPRQGSSVEAKA